MAPAVKIHKSIPTLDVKVDETQEGVATAIVSVFGVIDSVNDIIHPGAFTKTIVERGRRLRVLDMHNTSSMSHVIGKVLAIREVDRTGLPTAIVEKFPEATGGLEVTIQFAMSTPQGKNAYTLLKEEYSNEFSIGFEILDSDNSTVEKDGKKYRIRNIRTIRLWELSSVIWGANPATDVVEVRSEEGCEVESAPDTLTTREYNGEEYIKRLGDVLHAALINTITCRLVEIYAQGVIDTDQFTNMSAYCTAQLNILRSGMPDDVALTPLSGYMSGMYLADDTDQQTKAGRVLNSTNYSKLTQASDLLAEVLSSAELKDSKSEDPSLEVPPQEPTAGPTSPEEQSPTVETSPVEIRLRRLSALDRRIELITQSGGDHVDA